MIIAFFYYAQYKAFYLSMHLNSYFKLVKIHVLSVYYLRLRSVFLIDGFLEKACLLRRAAIKRQI